LEQTLVTIETERLQLEVAFAALTSDDPADRPATSLIRRDAKETPVMVSAPPVPASEPQAVLLAPSVVARKAKGPRSRKILMGAVLPAKLPAFCPGAAPRQPSVRNLQESCGPEVFHD
jgi:hypothetical protein